MTRLLPLITLFATASLAASQPYEIRTWPALTDRDWTAMALRLRRAEAGRWYYAEGEHFIVGSSSLRNLDRAAQEAGAALAFYGGRLGLPPPGRKAVVLLVEDPDSWTNLSARADLRTDGVGVQSGREIFVRVDKEPEAGRIAHEMTHFILRQTCGRKLPLWLEEGLAVRWAAKALLDAAAALPSPRRLEPLPADRLLRWEALLATDRYPAGHDDAAAFYRQAAEAVVALEERFGERGLVQLVRDVSLAGGDVQRTLAARGWKTEDFNEWSADMIRRCGESRMGP